MFKKKSTGEPEGPYTGSSKLPFAKCDLCTLKDKPLVHPSGDGLDYIAFVGEAPGKTEVIQDKPFVGKAGQLLHQIITQLDLDLERMYYTNSVMCRPPENRDPTKGEIDCCRGRLFHEISGIGQAIIMPLGKFGHQAIFQKAEGIRKARGKPAYLSIGKNKFLAMSSVHPAALLRNPSDFPDLCFDLKKAHDICMGGDVFIQPPIDVYVTIQRDEPEKMRALLRRLESVEKMSVDLETDGLRFLGKDIVTCALSWKGETAVAFDWDILRDDEDLWNQFADALERIKCSFHNGPFDIPWLRQDEISPNYGFDTMLGNYTLDERSGVHSLERLAISWYKAPTYKFPEEQIKNTKSIPRGDLLTYNATDADYTRRLSEDISGEMDKDERSVMRNLLIPAAKHFTEFFITGMLVDQDQLELNGMKWAGERGEIEEQLRSFPGSEDVNPNSPKQVASYIFDTLGLEQMGEGKVENVSQALLLEEIQSIEDPEAQDYWRTQSSKATENMSSRSTATYMLFWLAQQHDWPRLMVKHRLLAKKYGTYYNGLKESMWDDGRMRPSFKLHGTVTGRQSSTDPNIHGTPKEKLIKSTYIADPGFLILYGDYPQAEVRMIGHLAGDKKLIEALGEGDIHRAIAKRLFRLTDEQYDALPDSEREKMRRAAKTVTFGIIYGRSAKGLAPQMGVSTYEAYDYIARFFDAMPGVRLWIAKERDLVVATHEVKSIFGRTRRFPLIASRSQKAEVQRMAVNMQVQSPVSDMTLMASLKTCRKFDEAGIRYLRWPQIHDSFMVVVEEGAVSEAAAIMKDTMENDLDFDTDVPFGPVEIKCGRSWGDLEDINEFLQDTR